MAENPETALTRKIMKALRDDGCWVVKFPGGAFSTTGVPDIVGVGSGGRFVAVEVKLPYPSKHNVSKIQAKRIREIREHGGRAGVACSVEEALWVVQGKYERCQREQEVSKKPVE